MPKYDFVLDTKYSQATKCHANQLGSGVTVNPRTGFAIEIWHGDQRIIGLNVKYHTLVAIEAVFLSDIMDDKYMDWATNFLARTHGIPNDIATSVLYCIFSTVNHPRRY